MTTKQTSKVVPVRLKPAEYADLLKLGQTQGLNAGETIRWLIATATLKNKHKRGNVSPSYVASELRAGRPKLEHHELIAGLPVTEQTSGWEPVPVHHSLPDKP